MVDVAFYRHTRRGIEQTLPTLLEKSLARGWRVVVQAATPQRVTQLDDLLWRYRPESFLPHGTRMDAQPHTQPIYLTCEADNPNDADARFFLDGARVAPVLASAAAPRERAVLLFFDDNEEDLASARAQWSELTASGFSIAYYQQDESGRWVKKGREPEE